MGVVRRYIDFLIKLLISTPLVLANIAQRTFEIVLKLRSCRHGDIIILTGTCTCIDYESAKYRVTL